jgi:hypothetical protein
MQALYEAMRIPAYLEAVFGQNRAGYGLDCYWRVNIAGIPIREVYSYWILLGQTEPCLWWRCKQAIMNGIMSFEAPGTHARL